MNPVCKARVHCRVCRTDEKQREACGLPDECPEGFTEDDLPTVKLGFVDMRIVICKSCDEKCSIKHMSPCRRRKVLARLQFVCEKFDGESI